MKCDDLITDLELSDAERQDAARRHAADCPACAVAMRRWLELKSALSETPPLSDQDRSIWRAAQGETVPRNPRLPLILAGAGAAVAAGVLLLLLWPRPAPPPTPGPTPAVETLTFSPERAAQEFANFDRQLDQFEKELTVVSNRVALADAKREVAELGDRYR